MREFVFFDFEVNSLKHREPIEVSYSINGESYESELFDCENPLDPGAQAVHHILKSKLVGKPLFKDSDSFKFMNSIIVMEPSTGEKTHTLVAHGLEFDLGILQAYLPSREPFHYSKNICTLEVARHYYKIIKPSDNAPESHSLQYLRYYFNLDEKYNLTDIEAHRAESDVIILFHLFNELYSLYEEAGIEDPIEAFIEITREAMLPQNFVIRFGKHANKTLSEIYKEDPKYIDWAVGAWTDEDLLKRLLAFTETLNIPF